jgi:hypothetical protein
MSDVPSPEQLAEYQRLAEVATAVQRAYQRGFEDGRRTGGAVTAAEPTGDTGAPGRDELREQVARWLWEVVNPNPMPWPEIWENTRSFWRTRADALLALPAVRDALAAQEAVRRVEEAIRVAENAPMQKLCMDHDGNEFPAVVATADLRRAIAGEER